jgi:hypothetical protein
MAERWMAVVLKTTFIQRRCYSAQRWCAVLFRGLSFGVLLVGIGLIAYAGVQWLQTGRWHPLTVDGALASWSTTSNWVAHPHSWYGLHRIVVWVLRVPLFVIVTFLGCAMIIISPAGGTIGRTDG